MEAALKLGVETMRHRSIIAPDKTGTISRKQARSAALAAKAARPATSRAATSAGKAEPLPQTLPVWERFLGQFSAAGSHQVMRSSLPSTQARAKHTAPVVKKTAAKKKGTKKGTSVA
jgi:hypothetical protein